MTKQRPDKLAVIRCGPSIEDLVRFKREADFHQKTAHLIVQLIQATRQEERGEGSYRKFDRAYESLISHLGMIAGVEELGSHDIDPRWE